MWTKDAKSAKILSLLMMSTFCLSHMTTPALAMELPENTVQSTDDLLIDATAVEPAVFSVTVPTSLPAQVDGYGVITTSDNAFIINNSESAVQIVDMTIQQTGNYTIVGYDESFANKKINSNQMALTVDGFKTQQDGTFTFSGSAPPVIDSGSAHHVNYSLKTTLSSDAVENMHAANLYITIDWANPVKLIYNANGGTFANGTDTNTIKYTDTGHWIGGSEEIPTRANCFFEGWYTDAALTQKYNPAVPTTDTTVYANWLTSYTVQHSLQSLWSSSVYELQESETFLAELGTVVWPETKTYDQYKTPSRQSLTIDDSGNCVLTYKYDRTNYWLDVNYIVDGVFTGGPGDGDSWPSGLYYNFMAVYLNGYLATHGRDYCVTQPFGTYYEIKLTLGEEFYYVGTYNEGADTWDNGTTLYRKPDSGILTENVGIRLVINSVTDDLPRYYITFDANGGEGYTEPMTMIFGNDGQEIDWLSWCNYTREGYTFGGWMTTPDGGTAEYQNEQKVSGLSNTNGETITLYALWIPNSTFSDMPEDGPSDGMEDVIPDDDMDIPDDEVENPDDENPEIPDEGDNNGEGETEIPTEPSDDEMPGEGEQETPDDSPEAPDDDSIDNDDSEGPEYDSEESPSDEESPVIPDNSEQSPDEPPSEEESDTEETPDNGSEDEAEPDDTNNNNQDEDSNAPDDSDTENPDDAQDSEESVDEEDETDVIPDETPEENQEDPNTEGDSDTSELPNEESDKEPEEEKEEPKVEPTYYCGLDVHKHGKDCPGHTCQVEEHEHTSACLVPAPPEEDDESTDTDTTEPETPSEPETTPPQEEKPEENPAPPEEISPPKEEEPTEPSETPQIPPEEPPVEQEPVQEEPPAENQPGCE